MPTTTPSFRSAPFEIPPFDPAECSPPGLQEMYRFRNPQPTTLKPKKLSQEDEALRGKVTPFIYLIRSRGGTVDPAGFHQLTQLAYRVCCPFCRPQGYVPGDRLPSGRSGDSLRALLVQHVVKTRTGDQKKVVGFSCLTCRRKEADIFDFFATLGPDRCPDIASELERLDHDTDYRVKCYFGLHRDYEIGFCVEKEPA